MNAQSLPIVEPPPFVDVTAIQNELSKTLTGEVRFDRISRALYSTDASVYQIVPLGVVLPRSVEDIVATVKICSRHRLPLTARGGGTSQAGQAIGAGVILDCSKYYHRILEINPRERWVRVEPGCVLDDLNLELKPHGLQFPLDISTSDRATIGGMVANNSSGTHSLIYGKTIDHVLELKVALADGTVVQVKPLTAAEADAKCQQQDQEGACYRIIQQLAAEHGDEIERRFPKILRRVGGYNLDRFVDRRAGGVSPLWTINFAHMLVGSEGTLAVTLEAKLNLVPLPKAKAVLVIQFHDLLDALSATPGILEHRPAAIEVVDQFVLDSTKLNPEASRLRDFLQGDPGAILIVEFYADSPAELPALLERLETDLKQRGVGYHYHRARDAAAQARIWRLRRLALGLSMAEKGDAKAISFVEDTAVDPKHLRNYIAEFLQLVNKHGTKAGVYAHASVGCLHVRPIVDLKTEAGLQRFEVIASEVSDLVLRYGGANSGEHGDGLVRSPFQEKMFGPRLYEAFRQIKRVFDPQNILNPGKVVDAPPLTRNLRYGPAYITPDVPTTFDFSADGGLTRAAELCAGVGECRKKRGGTMCPSYQATCEEKHSTRGRSNILRLAITGQQDFTGFTDPAVKEALDLCLECKACKSECPTNVDMARLKAEFLHQYHQKHGLPWRNWVFGKMAGGIGFFPRLYNWWIRSVAGRWLHEKLLGIDRRRIPPALHIGDDFIIQLLCGDSAQSLQCLSEKTPGDPRPALLWIPDTFTNHYEPGIGMAGAQILGRLGWRSRIIHNQPSLGPDDWLEQPMGFRCCGRPMISNGMLNDAIVMAKDLVERLYPWAEARKPIVACEPSCILTIKDDYPALLRGEEHRKAEVVAKQCFTFEELLESTQISFRPGPKRILVQPHCHQRSLVGAEPLLKLLRRIPGAEVIDLEAGCCGMAGSFGYEKEHYEISRLVGEQRLFPAIRAAGADTVIVAPGFSCRMQIEHFTGRKAVHPAELLCSLVSDAAPHPG